MVSQIADIEFIATETEAEALLAEQEFIKRHRPVFNVRLRDDKSYPYIGISLDEDFPRIYFTRERHRKNRVYFGPFSNAKRVRETLDLLGKVFMHRTCDGPQPGRASGSPCLDYYIKRCQAPCVGYISKEAYARTSRRSSTSSRVATATSKRRSTRGCARPRGAGVRAGRAVPNKLKAVRSLLERQRISNAPVGTLDAIAVAAEGTDANAQASRSATACWPTVRASTSRTPRSARRARWPRKFILQYYASAIAVPPQVVVQQSVDDIEALSIALTERRGAPVEVRYAERGDKRRILELAERNARLALDQDRLRSERRRSQRIEALDGLQRALGMEQIRCASSASTSPT